MEEKEKTIQLNTEDRRDTIVYTFVVPRGEVYSEEELPEEQTLESDKEPVDGESEEQTETESQEPQEETKDTENTEDTENKEDTEDTEAKDGEADKTEYGLPPDHPEMGELAERQEARRRSAQNKKQSFRTRFYVITTAIIVTVGGVLFSLSSFFTVDSIVVQGNSHYTAEEIINMGHASPGRNIIYKANKQEIKEYLEQNPYIKSAVISRRLPSTLVIRVTERKERLAFRYDDDYLVMDDSGILLKKVRTKPKITIVEGFVVNKIKLGEKVGIEKGRKLDMALDLVKLMLKNDLYFVKFDVSDEKTIRAYVYDTLVVKCTYENLEENMKNGRLHLVLENLFKDGIERGTITFEDDGSASFMPIF